ncbi:hypothetical protein Naga_100307g6, partial [Nannochloropsis gaditana]
MAGRSAKYSMGRRDEAPFLYGSMPPPPHAGAPPPYASGYEGSPGNNFGVPPDGSGSPPPPSPLAAPRRSPGGDVKSTPPPMPAILNADDQGGVSAASNGIGADEGGAGLPSPWETLNKHQSHRITNIPPYSSLTKKEAPMYEELINFPRAKDKDDMRCVMCGLPPGEHCVIPRQNKDVCKDCDKATWQHADTQVYFKWCKGCKKFLKLSSFSQKLDAAKCDKCRERGRQSYLAKKGKDGEDASHHLGHAPHHRHHHPHPPVPPPHPHMPHHMPPFPHGPPP